MSEPTSKTATITNETASKILDDLKAPRITLQYIESRIARRDFVNPPNSPQLTLCILTLDNGFIGVGKSAPASPSNFNADLGQKYAYDNAVKELWPAFGFTLCEVLHTEIPLMGISQ